MQSNPPRSAPPPKAEIKFRRYRFLEECERIGLATDVARAQAFGVSRTHISLIQSGRRQPGWRLTATILAVFHGYGLRFEDLFEVCT